MNVGVIASGECLEGKGPGDTGLRERTWGSPLSVGVVSEGLADEGVSRDLAKCLRRCPETPSEASLWAQVFLSHLSQLGAPDKQVRYLEPNTQAPLQPGVTAGSSLSHGSLASWPNSYHQNNVL